MGTKTKKIADRSYAKSLDLNDCSDYACNGYGKCVIGSNGQSIESFECLCDLWHTGQKCDQYVSLPVVVAATCTVLASFIFFFCWYSSHRFSKKKIHIPPNRNRFVDYLNAHQQMEKDWLKNTAETMVNGKTRDIPVDEKVEEEPEKSVKETKKEAKKETEEKPKVETPKEKSATMQVERVKEAEKIKELLKSHEEASQNRSSAMREPEEAADPGISGEISLKPSNSAISNKTSPTDAPMDHKRQKQKNEDAERRMQEKAEKEAVTMNNKKKK